MKFNEFATEAVRQRLDPKCWKGKHKEGTKIKGGVRVNNCVPNESQELNEYIVRSGDDISSVMALNLFKDLLGDANLSDYDEEFANSPEWQAVVDKWAPKAEFLQQEIYKYQNVGRKLRDAEADAIDATAYDGSDAYEDAETAASYLPKIYARQLVAIVRLLKDGYGAPDSTMHEAESAPDEKTWMAQIKSKYPNVRWLQAKMPGAPLLAYVDGKEVARFNYNKELDEEFDLIESIINQIANQNGVDAEMVWEDLESLTEDELYAFAVTSQLNEDWQKVNKKDKTDGMSKKAVSAYRREHPGSKLKTAVTTKPSKLKKGSKASKRRKSYCSRSKGQMKMHNISCAKTPDKAICKARRRWNC